MKKIIVFCTVLAAVTMAGIAFAQLSRSAEIDSGNTKLWDSIHGRISFEQSLLRSQSDAFLRDYKKACPKSDGLIIYTVNIKFALDYSIADIVYSPSRPTMENIGAKVFMHKIIAIEKGRVAMTSLVKNNSVEAFDTKVGFDRFPDGITDLSKLCPQK